MKRRVVAIFLSLTLCMGGTLEAGAAALERISGTGNKNTEEAV